MRSEALGEIRFVMASRKGRRARDVVQQVWTQTLQLPDGRGGFVQTSCIVAKEMQPAARMIDWYGSRWEIEMFIHVLKNGCRIGALQLGSIEKIERALVMYVAVAWRIARFMRLERAYPDLRTRSSCSSPMNGGPHSS